MGYRIRRREPVGKGLRRIVGEQIQKAERAARDRARPQEDRVHDVRTRLKRSRAVLALIRRDGGEPVRRDDRRLRDVARLLSRPRDLAVQAHTFRLLGTRLQSEVPARLVAGLSAVERRVRRGLRPDEVERDLRRAARMLRRVRRALGGWHVAHGRRAISGGLTRMYRNARAGLEAVRAEPSPEQFHDWRKQVKALSNQLRLIRQAIPELTTTLMPKIERLGELLGEVHDLHCAYATAEMHPRSFGRAEDGLVVLAAVEERRATLESEALALAETVFSGRARDVRALIKTGWRTWRRGETPGAEAGETPPATLH
ncbi:MAG TPA: CHAD domain-containing protein [Polyangia bacterium]|nr:CHAD domain-containing protein [Polyangia bacterium]